MKSKEKILYSIILCLLILMPTRSNATLQANGKTESSGKSVEQWLEEIRYMEAEGGTLGLNGLTNLTNEVNDNINLDVHMQKNTEYGAMAILSASSYGKPKPVHVTDDGSLSTTTGNKSGVYMDLNKEWVSGGPLNSTKYKNASIKYKVAYTTNGREQRSGDAMLEATGWHNTGTTVTSTWFEGAYYDSGLLRAYSGSIFSFRGLASGTNWHADDAYYQKQHYCRAVVVVGERILIIKNIWSHIE